jgi:hypothetical protein
MSDKVQRSRWTVTQDLGYRFGQERLVQVLDGMQEVFGVVAAVEFASHYLDFVMARGYEAILGPVDSNYDGDRLAEVADWVAAWINQKQGDADQVQDGLRQPPPS